MHHTQHKQKTIRKTLRMVYGPKENRNSNKPGIEGRIFTDSNGQKTPKHQHQCTKCRRITNNTRRGMMWMTTHGSNSSARYANHNRITQLSLCRLHSIAMCGAGETACAYCLSIFRRCCLDRLPNIRKLVREFGSTLTQT